MWRSEVTWGDALMPKVFRSPGGLNAAVFSIRKELGPIVGVRNTFAKLLSTDDPADLNDADQFRAWLLLVAIGQEPADWGVNDEAVPAGYNRDRLRAVLPVAGAGFEPATSGLYEQLADVVQLHPELTQADFGLAS